jgi:phage terminase small subunit
MPRGRPPKPTVLKINEGNRGKRALDPAAAVGAQAARDLMAFAQQLGLTPLARQRLDVQPQKEVDEMEAFLNGLA